MTDETGLVQYDAMRQALQCCARIDEVKEIHDKAKALELYAMQIKDKEMEVWVTEIKIRAEIRMGELTRDLEKVEFDGPSSTRIPSSGKPKTQVIKEAGLSKSATYRYESLAGPADEATTAAVMAATEQCFAEAHAVCVPVKEVQMLKVRQAARGVTVTKSNGHGNGQAATANQKRADAVERFLRIVDKLPMTELVTEQRIGHIVGDDLNGFRIRCAVLPWLSIETVLGGWIFKIDTELREICEGRRPRPSLNGESLKTRLENLRQELKQRRKEVYGRINENKNWNPSAISKLRLTQLADWMQEELDKINLD